MLVLGGESTASLAGSRWAWQRGCKGGHLDALDLEAVGRLAALVRTLVADDALRGVHDVADGGLALALAEMVAISATGFRTERADHLSLFAEAPDRVVVCVEPARTHEVMARAESAGVAARELGRAGGDRLVLGSLVDLAVTDVVAAWTNRLPTAFGTAASH